MAPIEPDLTNSNLRPLLAGTIYLTTTTSLLALIGYRVFYRAYISLPPSQATRFRERARTSHELIFASLAAVSLAASIYYGYQFLLLSYQIWAFERGEIFPTGLLIDEGLLSQNGPKLLLGRWFRDTDLTAEFWEISMEKTRRRWWTNQLFLSTVAWTTFVSVTGRARGIPHLWAFVALAPLTSLSFVVNLFFIAVLITPLPIPADATALKSPKVHKSVSGRALKNAAAEAANRADTALGKLYSMRDVYFPPKPQNWTPHPLVSLIPLVLTMVHTILLSFASNTTAFHSLLNSLFIDMFLPVILPIVLPASWGSTNSAHHHHTKSLTTFSLLSLALHLFQTLIAVSYNDPGAHRHRHSVLFFRRDADRTQAQRTATAFGRVIGAIFDHPAVSKVGSDVLLMTVSIATWAAIRGLDGKDILRAAGWARKSDLETVTEVKDLVVKEVQHLIHSTSDEEALPETPSPRRGHKKRASKAIQNGEATGEKGSGAKSYHGQATETGEEAEEADWESAALVSGMIAIGGLVSGVVGVLGSDIGL